MQSLDYLKNKKLFIAFKSFKIINQKSWKKIFKNLRENKAGNIQFYQDMTKEKNEEMASVMPDNDMLKT